MLTLCALGISLVVEAVTGSLYAPTTPAATATTALASASGRIGQTRPVLLSALLPGRAARADDGDGDGDGDGGGGGGGSSGDGGTEPHQRGDMALREVIAAGLTPAQLDILRQRGYEVVSERGSNLMGRRVVLLRMPLSAFFRDPLAEIRDLGDNVMADRNHYYRTNAAEAARAMMKLAAWPAPTSRCGTGVPIGLIDTKVDTTHPALKGASIRVLALPDREGLNPSRSDHGTAVASLLVGGRSDNLPSLAPRTRLIAVDAFRRGRFGDERMEAWDLLAAMDAVIGAGARVVNMSFAGEPNTLLEDALQRVHRRGIVTVAAVGNRGPQSPPLYPAAYDGVIGVTAVGNGRRIYHRASRGDHVDLAAPGVDIPTASGNGNRSLRSGTSFAAPFVTAAAAVAQHQRRRPLADLKKLFASHAEDLGQPGRDPVYGHGLIQMSRLCRG